MSRATVEYRVDEMKSVYLVSTIDVLSEVDEHSFYSLKSDIAIAPVQLHVHCKE